MWTKFFSDVTLRKFHVLHREHCEDRSLFPSYACYSKPESSLRENFVGLRLIEEEKDKKKNNNNPNQTYLSVTK